MDVHQARQAFKSDVQAILEEELARVQREALAVALAHAADLVAVTTELADLRDLLDGTPALLELAVEMVSGIKCGQCSASDNCPGIWSQSGDFATWRCHMIPAQLRELALALREALGEEEPADG